MAFSFGEILKNLRKQKAVTQSQLAEILNVHLQTISKWERDVFEPDISILSDLAKALGVSIEVLCGIEEGEEVFTGCFSIVEFGKSLAGLRTCIDKSQEALATDLGVTSDTISKWERGITCPDIATFRLIVEYYKVVPSKLYYGIIDVEQKSPKFQKRRKATGVIIALAISNVICIALIFTLWLYFKPTTFTLTLEGDTPIEYTVQDNELFTPPDQDKRGYELLYYVDGDGNQITFPIKVEGNTVFKPIYRVRDYAIDVWLNGGVVEGYVPTNINLEDGALTLPTPYKEGANFEGWYLTADYQGESVSEIVCSYTDICVYAKWSDGLYEVRYALGGGVCSGNPTTISANESFTLAEPTKKGYTFLGWYDSAEGGKKYEEVGGEGASNITLYALWQKSDSPTLVTYHLNGGEVQAELPAYVATGETLTLPTVQKAGYVFFGWYLNAEGLGESVKYISYRQENYELFAIFKAKTYVITYEYEGVYAKQEDVNPSHILYGESVTLNPVELYGYTFEGWYDKREGGTKIDAVNSSNILKLSTLYARFTPNKYNVTFNADGGILGTAEGNLQEYTKVIEFGNYPKLPIPIKGELTFVCWVDEGGKIVAELTNANIRNMRLTAKYVDENGMPIEYVLNGGSDADNPERVYYGQTIVLLSPKRTGYTFLGWNTKADGSGEYIKTLTYDDGGITLYAVWQEIKVNGEVEYFEYTKGATSVTITEYKGTSGENVDLVFPTYIEGLPVTEIGDGSKVFGNRTNLSFNSVTLPQTLVKIGDCAFGQAFEYVKNDIIIPANVEVIGRSAFYCPLKKLSLVFSEGSKLSRIEECSMSFDSPKPLILPKSVRYIMSEAFLGLRCPGIVLNEGLTYIAQYAFEIHKLNPQNIVYIPSSVTYLGDENGWSRVYSSLSKEQVSQRDYNHVIDCYNYTPKKVTLIDGNSRTIIENTPQIVLPQPTKEGYDFTGWKDTNDNIYDVFIIPETDLTLTATYVKYTEGDGRINSPKLIEQNKSYTFSLKHDQSIYLVFDVSKQIEIQYNINYYYLNDGYHMVSLTLDGVQMGNSNFFSYTKNKILSIKRCDYCNIFSLEVTVSFTTI